MPPPLRRRACSISWLARAASPSSEAHIASASGHTGWSETLRPGPTSGQSAAGSAVAKAAWTATVNMRGVNWSTSTAWTSIRALSASPIRSSSQARSAIQSTSLTCGGAEASESKARRRRIEVQRDGKGALSRPMRPLRKRPLALPKAPWPRPQLPGRSGPTGLVGRRELSGISIGGGRLRSAKASRSSAAASSTPSPSSGVGGAEGAAGAGVAGEGGAGVSGEGALGKGALGAGALGAGGGGSPKPGGSSDSGPSR